MDLYYRFDFPIFTAENPCSHGSCVRAKLSLFAVLSIADN